MTTVLSPVTHVVTCVLGHLIYSIALRILKQRVFICFCKVVAISLTFLKDNFGQQTHSSGSAAFLGPSPLINIHGKAGGRGT